MKYIFSPSKSNIKEKQSNRTDIDYPKKEVTENKTVSQDKVKEDTEKVQDEPKLDIVNEYPDKNEKKSLKIQMNNLIFGKHLLIKIC